MKVRSNLDVNRATSTENALGKHEDLDFTAVDFNSSASLQPQLTLNLRSRCEPLYTYRSQCAVQHSPDLQTLGRFCLASSVNPPRTSHMMMYVHLPTLLLQNPELAHVRILVNVSSPQPPLLASIANIKGFASVQHPSIVEYDALSWLH